ncbi:MAG: hypothetical protein COZ06_09670 [Armatimonadetes bacterium CG_4_10_14_3_um_filter_66_18]|nr:MAG: hypothetical protein COZ06_09670 [Armatimonadetes bacterium CG_4_10_14_3_um_filter_66_18]
MTSRRTPTPPAVVAFLLASLACAPTLCGCRTKLREAGDRVKDAPGKPEQTDATMATYREEASLSPSIREPRCVALGPNGSIYVGGRYRVERLTSSGEHDLAFEPESTPTCLAVAQDGTVFLGASDHVEVYESRGGHEGNWDSLGDKAALTSLAVGKDDVFVADAGNRIVLRYSLKGKLVSRIGKKDDARNVPGFAIPNPFFDLALGPAGLLWVVNPGRTRVEAYTYDGDFELAWGKPSLKDDGFSGCCNPVHLAVDPTGGFVTSEKGVLRIRHCDAVGDFDGLVAGPDALAPPVGSPPPTDATGEEHQAFDLAVDSGGRVLALDTARKSLRVFVRKKGGPATDGKG